MAACRSDQEKLVEVREENDLRMRTYADVDYRVDGESVLTTLADHLRGVSDAGQESTGEDCESENAESQSCPDRYICQAI